MASSQPHDLPDRHREFLGDALPRLREDDRLVGIAAGGSVLSGTMDEYSDLDLVVAVEPEAFDTVMGQRHEIAGRLGSLLAAFTGEHVDEPRLLVCLYGPPPLHVDLKFVSLPDAADRVEDPVILWERDGRLREVLSTGEADFPDPDLQWMEDRFWVWVHYIAGKIGRGELFEAHDSLAMLRLQVLGPLALREHGARPSGVRKLEIRAPEFAGALRSTIAPCEPDRLADALRNAAELYRTLRGRAAGEGLTRREAAERASLRYLDEVARSLGTGSS